ncbi:MAG: DUF169 domain-containing protein [Desulfovibrionaceae bacterium]|jgi:uncharacterized protein (DUF169 family)|nr:DUF169 domain-containing protein [Desulfovibrionaceae bacterium]
MESAIVRHLQPTFEPVAVVWSDMLPADAFQFKAGRFGCILHLFAEASRRGRIAAADRESVACPGGRAALGFGVEFDASADALDHFAALFSKGLAAAENREAYRSVLEAAPRQWRDMYEYGERMHCSLEAAKEWIRHGLPRYDAPCRYVLFKPLRRTDADEDIRAVIFPVSPVELAGLTTLAGSVLPGTDPVQVPTGADCNSITAFAHAQGAAAEPRAVLGMLGIDGREVMRRRFQEATLTLTLPRSLFERMEAEADDSVFRIPAWRKLVGR